LPVYGLHTVLVVGCRYLVRPANKNRDYSWGTSISLPSDNSPDNLGRLRIGRLVLRGKFEPLNWVSIYKYNILRKFTAIINRCVLRQCNPGVNLRVNILFSCVFYGKETKLWRQVWPVNKRNIRKFEKKG